MRSSLALTASLGPALVLLFVACGGSSSSTTDQRGATSGGNSSTTGGATGSGGVSNSGGSIAGGASGSGGGSSDFASFVGSWKPSTAEVTGGTCESSPGTASEKLTIISEDGQLNDGTCPLLQLVREGESLVYSGSIVCSTAAGFATSLTSAVFALEEDGTLSSSLEMKLAVGDSSCTVTSEVTYVKL